jgi:hypothetical protein
VVYTLEEFIPDILSPALSKILAEAIIILLSLIFNIETGTVECLKNIEKIS